MVAGVTASPRACSGARYAGVPTTPPSAVIVDASALCSGDVIAFATPKSRSAVRPSVRTMTFVRLDVAMDEAAVVSGLERLGDAADDGRDRARPERPGREHLAERRLRRAP